MVTQIFSPIARKLQGLHISKDFFLWLFFNPCLYAIMDIHHNKFQKIDQLVSTKKWEPKNKDILLNVKL
ncbi:hypothetical protein BGP_5606 [Beggiatoa sp. PS]|nr:hypothetical protein BGP_5606 [Beggiatoa sp. PS]